MLHIAHRVTIMTSLLASWRPAPTCVTSRNSWGKTSKTTEIYTHVSKRDNGRIRSPLDDLMDKIPTSD